MKGIFELNWCLWLFCFSRIIKGSPINQEPETNGYHDARAAVNLNVDITKACIYNDNVYQPGDMVPKENPCDSCMCTPPGISCSTKPCAPKKPWCKAIQKANKCCPEYVCDCEKNGKKYEHNEKMEVPDPCKVCYCRGGEMECTSVTCYSRTDCEPVHVEGKCCPKYDHCPPLEAKKNTTSSSNKKESAQRSENDFSINNISSEEPDLNFSDLNKTTEVQMTPTTTSLDFISTNSQIDNEVSDSEFSNSTADNKNITVDVEVDYGEESDLRSLSSDVVKQIMLYEGGMLGDDNKGKEVFLRIENKSYDFTTVGPLEDTTQFSVYETTTIENSTEIQRNSVSEDWENIEISTEDNLSKNISTEKGNETTLSKMEELAAPGLKMLSADQIEFLQLGEELPEYVEPPDSVTETETRKESEVDVVFVPETTPITVEMTKVTENKSLIEIER